MTTIEVDPQLTPPINKRGPRILLGVTGSVAAVKAPEVAVQLVTQCNAEVKVVLSRGGKTFWDKAAEYDPASWKQLCELLQRVNENGNRAVEIHGTYRSVPFRSVPFRSFSVTAMFLNRGETTWTQFGTLSLTNNSSTLSS
jgi:hypothetical protein